MGAAGAQHNPPLHHHLQESQRTEVGGALQQEAEVAETVEMLSSSSGREAFISAGVMQDGGMGDFRAVVEYNNNPMIKVSLRKIPL